MLSSKVESGKISGENENSSSLRLLRDIEEINKALYLQKPPPESLVSASNDQSKSRHFNEDLLQKNKKSSIWSWKPLKALSHFKNHRFNCCFFLRVHSITGLPSNFSDFSLYVHWKRKDEVLQTCHARVCQGVAEFEETLMHQCSVYGSKSGPHHSINYEPKLFLLYASVVGIHGLDIGKHWIDLTRLLPLTFEDLQEEKRSSGKWMTSFKLTGKAEGAILNASFGFSVVGDSSFRSTGFVRFPDVLKGRMDHFSNVGGTSGSNRLRRLGSVPSNSNHILRLPSRSLDIKVLNDVFPDRRSELNRSITFLYQKLDEGKVGNSEDFSSFFEQLEPLEPQSGGENSGEECDDTDFIVTEQGVELPTNDQVIVEEDVQTLDGSVIETIDVAEIFKGVGTNLDEEMECNSIDEDHGNLKDGIVVDDTKEPMSEDFESFFNDLSISDSAGMDSLIDKSIFLEKKDHMNTKLSFKKGKMTKSYSFDDVTESVANDFLNLLGFDQSPLDLGFDSEPESPRERLLRQFEKDALASGYPIFDSDTIGEEDYFDDFDLSLAIEAAEMENHMVSQSLRSRRDAKFLENLETEALMREWGLNEKAFQNSPRASSGGFGSPVYIGPEEPPDLPHLKEGLGPFLRTEGGNLLRSMNPLLFRNARNSESLIMQVSGPVVLPTAMGSSGMEILECWALAGVEKMSLQANELMPLENITGKTLQQVTWESASRSEVLERNNRVEELLSRQICDDLNSNSTCGEMDSGHVFLEDLAPLAMDKIAAISIEGLRVQSGMSYEEAPSSIRVQPMGKISSSLSKSNDVDELIRLSISLDEWMRLDTEIRADGGEISGQSSNILAAHFANYTDLISENLKIEDKLVNQNNFTIALMVQLRDPFRDFETVGLSMLALIQVERTFVPMKPYSYDSVSERSDNGEDSEHLGEKEIKVEERENRIKEPIPQFNITEVHVAGLNAEPGEKQVWGTKTQQQSGSRWLLSSGLSKINRQPFSKSNAIVRSSSRMLKKVRYEDSLWSISSHVHGEGAKWKELATFNLHVRNPDIVFVDKSIRLDLL